MSTVAFRTMRTVAFNDGHVANSGVVILRQDEDYRRSIRPEAIDSITVAIGEGVATLHLRTGESIDVTFFIDVRLDDPFNDFNNFCWAIEALINEGSQP